MRRPLEEVHGAATLAENCGTLGLRDTSGSSSELMLESSNTADPMLRAASLRRFSATVSVESGSSARAWVVKISPRPRPRDWAATLSVKRRATTDAQPYEGIEASPPLSVRGVSAASLPGGVVLFFSLSLLLSSRLDLTLRSSRELPSILTSMMDGCSASTICELCRKKAFGE